MAFFVIPVFKGLFDDNPGDLPLGTRLVFDISDWLVLHGATLFGVMSAALLLTWLLVRFLPGVRHWLDRLLLALPVIGKTVILSQSARLTGVLGTLLTGGVPLVNAVQIASETSTNRHVRQMMARVQAEIRQGEAFAGSMAGIDVIPTSALRLISIGDEAGRLGQSCSKASQLLEKALRSRLKSLVALVEPLTILVMGGVVGFVVVSMLLAVFGLTDLAA
jgi:type II secretory pathway component PulF